MQPNGTQLAGCWRGRMLAPLYRIYERRLLGQVRAFAVPRHIGLILDGLRHQSADFIAFQAHQLVVSSEDRTRPEPGNIAAGEECCTS